MENNSLILIKKKLENYKSTHPKLYKIFKIYIELHEKKNNLFIENISISINNLNNIEDLTERELLLLSNLYNHN